MKAAKNNPRSHQQLPIDLLCISVPRSVVGSWRDQRGPRQALGEHGKSTQKGLSLNLNSNLPSVQ